MRLFAISMLLLLPWTLSAAGDSKLDRATLQGVTAVGVAVDPTSPDLQKQGVSAEDLRAMVSDRLLRAGITVDPAAAEFLGLRVISAQARRTPVALCVEVGFYQPVALARNPQVRTATDTWGIASVEIAQPKAVQDAARDAVNQLVDRFVEAYRSVNPR